MTGSGTGVTVRRGVTRVVFVGRRWAVKMPSVGYAWGVRGWLANRSEWRQRRRRGVARPVLTLGHVVLVMPVAERIGRWDSVAGEGDEAKPSSWGWFGDRGWLLVDFDRAWEQDDRGWVGGLYYGRQERLARRWSNLPPA
jgi:hypothetical protein